MAVALVGIGRTDFSKASGRTPKAMAVSACRAADADAGLAASVVNGMTT